MWGMVLLCPEREGQHRLTDYSERGNFLCCRTHLREGVLRSYYVLSD